MTLFERSAILLRPQQSIAQEHCINEVSYVHVCVWDRGVVATLVHSFLQTCKINNHWQREIDHNLYFMLLLAQKSRTFLVQSLFFWKRLRSCVGIVPLSKLYLRNACLTGTQNILLFLYWTWGMHKKYYPCYFPCYCSNTLLGVWNPTWCCYVDTYACWKCCVGTWVIFLARDKSWSTREKYFGCQKISWHFYILLFTSGFILFLNRQGI